MTSNQSTRKVIQRILLIVVGVSVSVIMKAQAAGFYLQEIGTPHSLGTAGVANSTNTSGADASWSNPAGMVYLQEDQVFAGFQAVIPNMEFDTSIATGGGGDGGNAGILAAVPSFFYVHKYSDRLSFGLSVAGTMGVASTMEIISQAAIRRHVQNLVH